ncbi:MAG: MarR family transcriptional regulator [Dermatophilus congolensis]|nr:MarR family transcriptional regulator [Dermatophilus congolensis]
MTTPRDAAERQLAWEIVILAEMGNRLSRKNAVGSGLHETDFRALAYIHLRTLRGQDVSPALVGAHLSLSSAAVTYLVDRLVKAGLVERVPDPQDGRRVILRFSKAGKTLTETFFSDALRHHREALAQFEVADIETTMWVLKALNDQYREYHEELSQGDAVASSGSGARDEASA